MRHHCRGTVSTERRRFLAGSGLGLAAMAAGATVVEPASKAPPQAEFPQLEFVYEARVTIAAAETVGEGVAGVQRIIPITGGSFEGPRLRGTVLPGSADWNLMRNDGMTVVSATYFMRTDDGVVLKIVNQGVNPKPDPTAPNKRPRFTTPVFEAPRGRYEWLNQSVFVGTLAPGDPGSVRIRVFKLV